MNEFHNVGQVGLVVDVNDSCQQTNVSLAISGRIITFPDQPVDNHGAAGDLEEVRLADDVDDLVHRDELPALHLPVVVERLEVLGQLQVEHELRVGMNPAL